MKVRASPGINLRWLTRPSSPRAALALPLALVLLASLIWLVSLSQIDMRQITNLGLVSVLPAPVLAAPVILIISFSIALSQSRLRPALLLLHVLVLIVMLYGITSLVQEVPRFRVNYRHAGITEYIMRNEAINPRLNAYFNWPGFFILAAFVTELSGLPNPIAFADWAPVCFNLLYLLPVLSILSSGTSDRRLVWLGVWLFFLTNWIGQDYFAPQALNYFFYLVIIAVLLRWFQAAPGEPGWLWARLPAGRLSERLRGWWGYLLTPADLAEAGAGAGTRVALLGLVVALAAVIAASHQATSLIMLASVSALVLFRRCSVRSLPIVIGVLVLGWISYMASAYMAGHFGWVIKGVGQVDRNLTANVTARLRGSPEHQFIVQMRILMTLAIGLLALLGVLRRLRQGYWSWASYALLVVAPFGVVLLQTYGGEMLLRSYLFALPANAFLAAALFFPSHTARTSWRTAAATCLTCVALLAGFFFTRYGNEKADYFTAQEAGAVSALYQAAPPGSLLLTGSSNTPWKYAAIERYRYANVGEYIRQADLGALEQLMQPTKRGRGYLLLLRSHRDFNELYYHYSPDDWERAVRLLSESPRFTLLYDSPDGKVFALAQGGARRQE